jgi:hypothetical protein
MDGNQIVNAVQANIGIELVNIDRFMRNTGFRQAGYVVEG